MIKISKYTEWKGSNNNQMKIKWYIFYKLSKINVFQFLGLTACICTKWFCIRELGKVLLKCSVEYFLFSYCLTVSLKRKHNGMAY